jgi:hypothetical protein
MTSAEHWLIAVDALADHVLTPVSANGSPAAAVYRPETPRAQPTAFAIHVLDVVAGRITAIHSFIDPTLFRIRSERIVLRPDAVGPIDPAVLGTSGRMWPRPASLPSEVDRVPRPAFRDSPDHGPGARPVTRTPQDSCARSTLR